MTKKQRVQQLFVIMAVPELNAEAVATMHDRLEDIPASTFDMAADDGAPLGAARMALQLLRHLQGETFFNSPEFDWFKPFIQ